MGPFGIMCGPAGIGCSFGAAAGAGTWAFGAGMICTWVAFGPSGAGIGVAEDTGACAAGGATGAFGASLWPQAAIPTASRLARTIDFFM